MKFILCAFTILLSVAVYPIILYQNGELFQIFAFIETDFFNWFRMILIGAMVPISLVYIKLLDWPLAIYSVLLLISTLASRFPVTSTYGNPMWHEAALAWFGYLGVYLIAKRHGFFKGLEMCFEIIVCITAGYCLIQLIYGNIFDFPPLRAIIPKMEIGAVGWPIYGNMGTANNLGLFCSLFAPYSLIKKKYPQFLLLLALLIICQSRAAWLSVIVTTTIISKRALILIGGIAIIFSIPMHNIATKRIKEAVSNIHWPIRDGDLSGRAYLWKRALPVMKDSILIGKGPATYVHNIPQFDIRGDYIGFFNHVIDRPHNMLISTWVSTGLLSLLVLSYWLFGALKNCTDASLKWGVIGFLITGVFTDSVLCVTPYLSIFLGGIIHGNNEARRHDTRARRSAMGDRPPEREIACAVSEHLERCS